MKCFTSEEKLLDFLQYRFVSPKPSKKIGFVEKMGMLVFSFNVRLLEVDCITGSLRRFKCLDDYPHKPQ